MFSFGLWADMLSKAVGHKYIKRIPYTVRGKRRYRYIYKVTHSHQGRHAFDEAHLQVGTAFSLSTKAGAEFHGHVTKIEGDKISYRIDDGPEKGTIKTESKRELLAKLNDVHDIESKLTSERDKLRNQIKVARKNKASEKQIARLESRLKRLGEKQEPEKQSPRSSSAPVTGEGRLDLSKLTPDQIIKYIEQQKHIEQALATSNPKYLSSLDLTRKEIRETRESANFVSADDLEARQGFKRIDLSDLSSNEARESLGRDVLNQIASRAFMSGNDQEPFNEWIKQINEIEKQAHKDEDRRVLGALKTAEEGTRFEYRGIPFEVVKVQKRGNQSAIYHLRLQDSEDVYVPKNAPASSDITVIKGELVYTPVPPTAKGLRYYEGTDTEEPSDVAENIYEAVDDHETAWREKTRAQAIKTPYEIPEQFQFKQETQGGGGAETRKFKNKLSQGQKLKMGEIGDVVSEVNKAQDRMGEASALLHSIMRGKYSEGLISGGGEVEGYRGARREASANVFEHFNEDTIHREDVETQRKFVDSAQSHINVLNELREKIGARLSTPSSRVNALDALKARVEGGEALRMRDVSQILDAVDGMQGELGEPAVILNTITNKAKYNPAMLEGAGGNRFKIERKKSSEKLLEGFGSLERLLQSGDPKAQAKFIESAQSHIKVLNDLKVSIGKKLTGSSD